MVTFPLIAEASNRRGRTAKKTQNHVDTATKPQEASTMAKSQVEKEKSSKFYLDGEYLNTIEDLGYGSGVSSPNESLKRSNEMNNAKVDQSITKNETPQLLKLEPAIDPLSVSLPETFLKSVKSDLSQSMKSTTSTKSRVHYDPRIFSSSEVKTEKKADPEKEYFANMSKFYGEMNEKFSDDDRAEDHNDDVQGDNLECIDLGDPSHDKVGRDMYGGRHSLADTVR